MQMYGFIENRNGVVVIANRIYETFLYNYFLSDEIMKKTGVNIVTIRNKVLYEAVL